MPYTVWFNNNLIAYIDLKNNKIIVSTKFASIIEPCLMAYGISVNFGIDEEIKEPARLEGYALRIHTDLTEDKIAWAIRICVALVTGIRPSVEPLETKIYEVLTPSQSSGEGEKDEGGIEFEKV